MAHLLSVLGEVSGDDSGEIYRHETTASEASGRSGSLPRRPDQSITSLIHAEMRLWLRKTPVTACWQRKSKGGQGYLFLNQ